MHDAGWKISMSYSEQIIVLMVAAFNNFSSFIIKTHILMCDTKERERFIKSILF